MIYLRVRPEKELKDSNRLMYALTKFKVVNFVVSLLSIKVERTFEKSTRTLSSLDIVSYIQSYSDDCEDHVNSKICLSVLLTTIHRYYYSLLNRDWRPEIVGRLLLRLSHTSP